MAQGDPKTATSVYDFKAVDIDGNEVKYLPSYFSYLLQWCGSGSEIFTGSGIIKFGPGSDKLQYF